ncbi:TBP-associated factor 5 [Perilla frutescens var. frutescens]|nr:TBP-associated factor 5 [Perilla frutescens var. frutescens]
MIVEWSYGGSVYQELGRTEVVLNSLSPKWNRKFNVPYQFETVQNLVFRVYDVGTQFYGLDVKALMLKEQQFLGEASCTLSELTVYAEESVVPETTVELILKCLDLESKDLFSKSDPFLVISKSTENGILIPISITEVLRNDHDPKWKPVFLNIQQVGGKDTPLFIECFNVNSNGKHDLLGKVQISLAELEKLHAAETGENLFILVSAGQNHENKIQLLMDKYLENNQHIFLNLNPMVAVDITAPRVKPELALPVIPVEVEQSILEDLRNRVQLNSMALPSISFYTFINTHDSLNCASISHDGSMVAGGFSDSSLKVWDMAKLGQQSVTYIEKFDLYTLVFMILGTLLGENELVSSEPSTSAGGRCYTLFRGHAGPVHSATFSPFGDFILSSSSDSTIRLWSTKLNANLVCYKGHNYPVWDVQFSPMGHYFASASHDRTARIWSMDRIQPLRIMAGHLSDVDCVQWHANCNYIATGSSDKTVRLWDVQSGECVRIFIGHRSMILSLAMSPDGRYMASGDEDGTIMMWDLASGRCVSPLVGHGSCIWSLAFR